MEASKAAGALNVDPKRPSGCERGIWGGGSETGRDGHDATQQFLTWVDVAWDTQQPGRAWLHVRGVRREVALHGYACTVT